MRGLIVVVVGPDGAGKSALAAALVEAGCAEFRGCSHVHWRPGILPRPGSLLGRSPPDSTRPHSRSPLRRVGSSVLLTYYLVDFLVGGWLRDAVRRARGRLVVVERGWWDLGVDPGRYRLRVTRRTVRALGRLLPRPDVIFLLEAPVEVIAKRKDELRPSELRRQLDEWPGATPPGVPVVRIDTREPADMVLEQARHALTHSRRPAPRHDGRWSVFPFVGRPRCWLSREDRRTTAWALHLFHPVTPRSLTAWCLVRLAARIGLLGVLRGRSSPPLEVIDRLNELAYGGVTVAIARAQDANRFVALSVADGDSRMLTKVAIDSMAGADLEREAGNLRRVGPNLPAPLGPPTILATLPGALVFGFASWRPRLRAWRLPCEVAAALGSLYRAGCQSPGEPGLAHGDCTPWNLLRISRGWVLVDWEAASEAAPSFTDIVHYLVQSHALLGRPSRRTLMSGLEGRGWVGRAIGAYAATAGVIPEDARAAMKEYLESTSQVLDSRQGVARRAMMARQRLLAALTEAPS